MTLELGHPIVKYVATGNDTKKTLGSRFYKVDLSASQESDCICSVVSIQNATCPYSDVLETSMRFGIWQTMLNQSTFVVDGKNYPNGFLIVIVASPSDKLCQIKKEENECKANNQDHNQLSKNVTITVKMNSSDSDYLAGILLVSGFYILLFVVIVTISYIRITYDINSPTALIKLNSQMKIKKDSGASRLKEALNSEEDRLGRIKKDNISATNSMESSDNISATTSMESDDPKDLRVSEMSKKLFNPMRKKSVYIKSDLYACNLMMMSIFYCLPVIQMVMEASSKIDHDQTGNQDLCYFNHLCQKPLGPLKDFNHVFSNLGYVVFGLSEKFWCSSTIWNFLCHGLGTDNGRNSLCMLSCLSHYSFVPV